MKRILILLLTMSACLGDDIHPAADAATEPDRGCMTNLPRAIDAVINSGDPIPGTVVTALQQMFEGDKRTYHKKQLFPSCWISSGAAATIVTNPGAGPAVGVWLIPTGVTVTTRIPFEVGAMVAGGTGGPPLSAPVVGAVGFQYEVYGDGVTDYTMNLKFAPGNPGVISGIGTVAGVVTIATDTRLNTPASWSTRTLAIDNLVTLTDIGVLYLEVVTSGGGAGINLGDLIPQFYRP